MNWYKKANNYYGIGHKGKYILWFSPDGQRIATSPIQQHEPNTTKGLLHNEWEEWQKDTSISPFRGRYDVNTKQISVITAGLRELPQSLVNNLMRSFPDAKTVYVYGHYGAQPEIIRLASNLRGEWWIIDSQAIFADSDVGEMGHEAHVVDSVQRKYAYDEFANEYVDWDGFKKELAMEEFEEQYGKRPTEEYYQKYKNKMEDLYLKKLKEMGITNEEYMIAEGMGDARQYGMEHLGWKRIAGNNIQTQFLTHDDLKNIANGLYDAYDEEIEDGTLFNIEVNSTNVIYRDVPYYLISDGSPSQIQDYGMKYAKKKINLIES
jgi:hypothetical protein